MSQTRSPPHLVGPVATLLSSGLFWFTAMVAMSSVFFREGIVELLAAWQLPEYRHGPLILVLSALLFVRHLKTVPVRTGPVSDRWPGVLLLMVALALALGGKLIQIGDFVAYALILWVGAVVLISFGWRQGRHFWPPVVHLVFMVPLPGALYDTISSKLQGISSELGVYLLQLVHVPVLLEGNIIDLGVYRLHVAEASSGLLYLFPILSFSYIIGVVYQGPIWHRAALLILAAPIMIFMNAIRIAAAGLIANRYGAASVEGFPYLFEGWAVFLPCIAILSVLAWGMLFLRRDRIRLRAALDLDTGGLVRQAMRLQYLQPSRALVGSTLLIAVLTGTLQALPQRDIVTVDRAPFSSFPTQFDSWQAGAQRALEPTTETILGADDYYSAVLSHPDLPVPVDLFIAWYADQSAGGVHSPEVCLPGDQWEITRLEQIDAPVATSRPFTLNRAVIEKDARRMLVYYWFEQQGRRTASGLTAKMQLLLGKLTNGRGDSAIVRLITPINGPHDMAAAEARLNDATGAVLKQLPSFIPDV